MVPITGIDMTMMSIAEADYLGVPSIEDEPVAGVATDDPEKLAETIERLEAEMREAARKFEFERAAKLRDQARALRAKLV